MFTTVDVLADDIPCRGVVKAALDDPEFRTSQRLNVCGQRCINLGKL
jgi:hypothetical protein